MEAGLPGMLGALNTFRLTGALHFLPYWEGHYAMVSATAGETSDAEAALTQCLEKTERTGERWSEAELHRYRGMLLEQSGKPPLEAEACYRQAIVVAQRQGAVAWELRATLNLARCLLAQQAKGQVRPLIESLLKKVSLDIDRESATQIESLLGACGEAKADD
jgi:predicted ATPase